MKAVKHVYDLSDQLLLELALEKIEGKALDWLHTKPGLMTLGIDHFVSVLLKEFAPTPEKTLVKTEVPSAPPKIDVCTMDLQGASKLYPEMKDFELKFNNLGLEQPLPSYDMIFKENLPKTQQTAQDKPKSSEENLDEEKRCVKPGQKRYHYNKRTRVRPSNSAHPPRNVSYPNAENNSKPTTNFGTRPKVICDYCQKPGHESNQCLSKAAKEALDAGQEPPAPKCNYCKEEGHYIRNCQKAPRCHNCGERFHKIKDCPALNPGLLEKPLLVESKSDYKSENGYCKNCSTMGHHTVDCLRNSGRPNGRCYRCNSEWHKIQHCPLRKSVQKNSESVTCCLM